jgi:hypothetical protein
LPQIGGWAGIDGVHANVGRRRQFGSEGAAERNIPVLGSGRRPEIEEKEFYSNRAPDE